jgi:1-phosphatidylinositol-3-phosphate 5-kinase
LLGLDEERKEIICGLVDTIGMFQFWYFLVRSVLNSYCAGSYTFAKTLEYKAKQGLNAGKDITVIPPAEYQERFISALEGYFLACPGLSHPFGIST